MNEPAAPGESATGDAVLLTPLDGPTAIIELAGTRFLVDPTFDPAQEYPVGGRSLVKTTDATWTPDQAGHVDAVLLSHDQHPDGWAHFTQNGASLRAAFGEAGLGEAGLGGLLLDVTPGKTARA